MTEIKALSPGYTFVGTAEGDHGVFTRSGRVYAGKIAYGCACVGVLTDTSGDTWFVECDADGKEHGRRLDCRANGHTEYRLFKHGFSLGLEWAVLYADGTCTYNGEACPADYAPFVALQAKVVPIKARPPKKPHTAAFLYAAFFFAPTARQSVQSATFWHSQELATTHADKVRARRLRHQPAWALWHSNCQTNAPRVQPGRCTGGRVLYACATAACVVHPSAVRARAANPHAPPLFPSRAARPRGASRSAVGCTCRFCTPRAARTCQRASPSRFAPRTCTPAPSHAPNCDAHSTRQQS
jgi:hypothetical protein